MNLKIFSAMFVVTLGAWPLVAGDGPVAAPGDATSQPPVETLACRPLDNLGWLKSAGCLVCRSEEELREILQNGSANFFPPMRPDAAAEYEKQKATQIAAINFEKEMVLAWSGSGIPSSKKIVAANGEVRWDISVRNDVRGNVMAGGISTLAVACPRRDLPVVFLENGNEVAVVPFVTAGALNGDKSVRMLLADADLVVAGKVTKVAALPLKGPFSEHMSMPADAIVEIESVEKGSLAEKTLTVRFNGSRDLGQAGLPKLKEGEEAILILKKTDGLYRLDKKDQVQPTANLDSIRKLLKDAAQ